MASQWADRKADAAAAALGDTWELWTAAVAGSWFERRDGLFVAVTDVQLPGFNGVWTERNDYDDQDLNELLDYVAGTGVPYCLQVRPGSSERAAAVAAARGMTMPQREPLMILDEPRSLVSAQSVDGLAIRELDPDEVSMHNDLAGRGFGIPSELLAQLMTPDLLRSEGTRFYVGESGGVPVTTGSGAKIGDPVGIFNIATPEEHRGRGYGAAVTARAVTGGLEHGAGWAYLQSSQSGFEVYKRLGFETVELWDCWVTG